MPKNDSELETSSKWYWDLVVAGALLTRLPLPHAPKAAFERQSDSVWAFPLVGILIGLLSCIIGAISFGFGLSATITAGLMLGTSMILTGGMHEDGLADCADGFWGGYEKERRLEIMKDSQIGTYGVLALIVLTGLRWLALSAVISTGFMAVIAAAALSRGVMPALMSALPHARGFGLSHSVGRPTQKAAFIAAALSGLFALLLIGLSAIGTMVAVALVALGIARLAKVKIGGQTGDVLGATQVMTETAILLCLAA